MIILHPYMKLGELMTGKTPCYMYLCHSLYMTRVIAMRLGCSIHPLQTKIVKNAYIAFTIMSDISLHKHDHAVHQSTIFGLHKHRVEL
jgi:hypothetical protein